MVPAVVLVVIPIIITLGLLRKYQESKWGKYKGNESLAGKVCIVTGANSGIGKETVRELVKRHAKVIMACRDIKSAKQAILDIRKTTANGDMIPLYVDLRSIDSIKTFANIILNDFPEIHILINNAGISKPYECKLEDKSEYHTVDGFEIHFGINYLGHFVLTNLLLSHLKKSAPSRIVVLSSSLFQYGVVDFDNLNGEKGWKNTLRRNQAYCNSKLQNAYFAFELAKRVKNTGVSVYTVCPGFCKTALMRYSKMKWYQLLMFLPVSFFFMRSANQGCQTVLFCALSNEVKDQSGLVYRDCRIYNVANKFSPTISAKLWEVTEKMLKQKIKIF